MQKLEPYLQKTHPSFPATPFKNWDPAKPPFWKIFFGGRAKNRSKKGGGAQPFVRRGLNMEDGYSILYDY